MIAIEVDLPGLDYNKLFIAAVAGEKLAILKIALEKGADVNFKDAKGNTALAYAVFLENSQFVKYIVEAGASLQPGEASATDLLTNAIENDNFEIFEYLYIKSLQANIAINLDKYLEKAVRYENNAICNFLLAEKDNINSKVSVENLAAIQSADAQEQLPLAKSISAIDLQGQNLASIKEIEAAEEYVEKIDSIGRTDLARAVHDGNLALVHEFISKGADVNKPDNLNRSPLSIAVENGDLETAEVLISHDAEVNSCEDEFYKTPLTRAIMTNNFEMAKLLIDKGAQIKVNEFYKSPMDLAIRYAGLEMIKLIAEKSDVAMSRHELLQKAQLFVRDYAIMAFFANSPIIKNDLSDSSSESESEWYSDTESDCDISGAVKEGSDAESIA